MRTDSRTAQLFDLIVAMVTGPSGSLCFISDKLWLLMEENGLFFPFSFCFFFSPELKWFLLQWRHLHTFTLI